MQLHHSNDLIHFDFREQTKVKSKSDNLRLHNPLSGRALLLRNLLNWYN